MTNSEIDGYSYYISNDSDDDEIRQDSSDEEELDEVNVFLRGTPEQKRKVLKSLTGDEASSSDDDFEKVMKDELEAKVKAMESAWKKSVSKEQPPNQTSVATSSQPGYYDDIYFDSDEGENEDKCKKQKMTDDELFYDPRADDEDQKWIDMQTKRPSNNENATNTASKNQETSDAILTCPACMTTLCVNCQRHSVYQNQYRAMFVMNCDIKYDELLHYKEKKKREFKRHKRRAKSAQAEDPELDSSAFSRTDNQSNNRTDGYHPVKCSVCNTEVAVYDFEEIYHFFNVLSGYA
ncbi:E2F-associated phosphoprotein-like [Styela clava]